MDYTASDFGFVCLFVFEIVFLCYPGHSKTMGIKQSSCLSLWNSKNLKSHTLVTVQLVCSTSTQRSLIPCLLACLCKIALLSCSEKRHQSSVLHVLGCSVAMLWTIAVLLLPGLQCCYALGCSVAMPWSAVLCHGLQCCYVP